MTDRKIRCRMNDRRRNPCSNEALTDFGVCLTHLQETHAEYEAVLSEAIGRHPSASPSGTPSGTPSRSPRDTLARTS